MTEATKKRLLELDARGKPTFVYRKAAETDVAALFARIRKEQKQAKPQAEPTNVCPLKKARKA